ncbi:hypothetical protein NDU88_007034 [Pleurodeles waltl]|uniref:Uncharacterized protein n=1 Tax=Pleurodeles waltl TaxID=8319 RepID=A0AAV7SRK2_PLEWA|nr:hypothetical protein NDU88_007034 [Pleurodeles waltl]
MRHGHLPATGATGRHRSKAWQEASSKPGRSPRAHGRREAIRSEALHPLQPGRLQPRDRIPVGTNITDKARPVTSKTLASSLQGAWTWCLV